MLTRHGETAAHSIRWARYHVMSRGDRREAIFYDDADRVEFLKTLGQACLKTGWQVHTYSQIYSPVVDSKL